MGNNQQQQNGNVSKVALWGIPAIALVCCGMPTLIVAIGFTAAGSYMVGHRYWLFGGMLFVMGIIVFVMSRRGRKSGKDCSRPLKDTLGSRD